jgi:hypothetical protein
LRTNAQELRELSPMVCDSLEPGAPTRLVNAIGLIGCREATDQPFGLSIKSLTNRPTNVHDDDFIFIVGDDRSECPTFLTP